jgi:hypothetical protein
LRGVHEGEIAHSTGPASTSSEPLGYYHVVEVNDIDAIIAAHIPTVRMGDAVEVRPLIEW